MNFILCFSFIFRCIFIIFLLWKTSLILCFCFCLLCWRRNNHFDVHFWRIGPVAFLSERWNWRSPWRMKWTERCLFPASVGIFPFIDYIIEVLFPLCTLIWHKKYYVSRQGKGINRRNESNLLIIKNCSLWVLYVLLKSLIVLSSLKHFPHNRRRSNFLSIK